MQNLLHTTFCITCGKSRKRVQQITPRGLTLDGQGYCLDTSHVWTNHSILLYCDFKYSILLKLFDQRHKFWDKQGRICQKMAILHSVYSPHPKVGFIKIKWGLLCSKNFFFLLLPPVVKMLLLLIQIKYKFLGFLFWRFCPNSLL